MARKKYCKGAVSRQKRMAVLIGTIPLCFGVSSLQATQFTYTAPLASDNNVWSSGINWTPGAPQSAATSELTFVNNVPSVISNTINDTPTPFLLNILDFNGANAGATSTAGSLNISGGVLDFESNGLLLPTVNLNATGVAGSAGTAGRNSENFNVFSGINLGADTTFTNPTGGTAAFVVTGQLTGAGSIIKSGSSRLVLGSVNSAAPTTNTFAYSGNLNVNAGTLAFGTLQGATSATSITDNFYSTGAVNIAGGSLDLGNSNVSVGSINVTGGSLLRTGTSIRTLTLNSVSTTSDLSAVSLPNGNQTYVLAGSGTLNVGNLAGVNSQLIVTGSGTINAVALSNATASSNATQAFPLNAAATVKFSGTSGPVMGPQTVGPQTGAVLTGTDLFQPTAGNADIVVTGLNTTNAALRSSGDFTFALDANGNNSLTLLLGNSASTTAAFVQNGTTGAVRIAPTVGLAGLGTTDKVIVQGVAANITTVVPQTNGTVLPWILGIDNDSNKSADFLNYNGSGSSSDIGFRPVQATPANFQTSFAASTNSTVVELVSPAAAPGTITLSGPAAAYDLRVDNNTVLLNGNTLTVGTGTSAQTGLILNGASIGNAADTGTLAFGLSLAYIYTSLANGSINVPIASSGSNTTATNQITKTGPGTLFLTKQTFNELGNTGNVPRITVDAGTIDVGTLTGATDLASSGSLPDAVVSLTSGVLEANGSFNRSLGVSLTPLVVSIANGGFAAAGGPLSVNIGGAALPQLIWNQTSSFSTDYNTLTFGAPTSDSVVTLNNPIQLGPVSPFYYRQISVASGTSAHTDGTVFSGIISDAANALAGHGILKDGSGSLTLSGNNLYNGQTAVSAGTLKTGSVHALGDSAATVSVSNGATLDLFGQTPAAGKSITLNGGSLINSSATPVALNTSAAASLTNSGNYTTLPTVTVSGTGTGATASVVAGVSTITLLNAGSGYKVAPAVTVTGGSGNGASATATLGLTAASFNSFAAGTNYVTGDIVAVTGGNGTGATVSVTASGGAVTGVTVVTPGTGYTAAPTGLAAAHSGTAATVVGNNANFSIGALIVGAGTGYTTPPTITIAPPTGPTNTQTATASDTLGILGIQFSNGGSGYTAVPTVTFSGGTSTSVATAVGGVAAINLTATSSIGGAGDIAVNSNIRGTGGITKIGTDTVTLSASNSYVGTTTISSGSVVVAAAGALGVGNNLTIGATGSLLAGTLASPAAITVGSLSVTGKLDINSNALVIHNTPLATVSPLVTNNFNGGTWNGATGITSTAAGNDPAHLTALGVIQNSVDGTPSGAVLRTSLDGSSSLTNTDVLVKYTYYGDSNLDGIVDTSDYSRIDSGYLNGATGWFNGDFNYDNVVNGSDYTLIDNAFNTQGATLAAEFGSPRATATAEIADSSAVPEPTTLSFLMLSAGGLLGRRRRRSER